MPNEKFVEFIVGSPQNRPGKCITRKESIVMRHKNAGRELYRSLYLYDEPFTGSTSAYAGTFSTDSIVIDIDNKHNDLECHQTAIKIYKNFNTTFGKKAVVPAFSGTGLHLLIDNSYFGFDQENRQLPNIMKHTILKLAHEMDVNLDDSIYKKNAIIRVLNSRNTKSGLYKIPLTEREFRETSMDYFRALAKKPRTDFDFSEYAIGEGEEQIKELGLIVKPKSLTVSNMEKLNNEAPEPSNIATCIHNILKNSPKKGSRRNTMLRIASHFRRNGTPKSYVNVILHRWLTQGKSMSEMTKEEKKNYEDVARDIFGVVENTYSTGYKYSCHDSLLMNHCSPECIYFGKKDYNTGVLSPEEFQQKAVENVDKTYEFEIKLDELWGLDRDSRIYPGEVCTILSTTGAGKTALAQTMTAGIDFNGQRTGNRLSTLYLSLEIPERQIHRRYIQMAYGLNKQDAIEYQREMRNTKQYSSYLDNIYCRTVSPNLNQILEEVRETECRVLVVDHLELLRLKGGTRERISNATRFFKQMALQLNIIVILISQIGRGNARNNTLDLHAGKESGSIEHDSDKVIGLWGSPKLHEKKIEFFKNREAERLWEEVTWVKMDNTFRFFHITEQDFENAWNTLQAEEELEL